MNYVEYNQKAERTLSTQFHCNDKTELMLHAAIGTVTEFTELMQAMASGKVIDVYNLREEFGDVFWYLSIFDRELDLKLRCDIPTTDLGFLNISSLVDEGMITAGEILDLYKKKLYYNREIDKDELCSKVIYLFRICLVGCEFCQTGAEEVRARNIRKLEARFPDKFTNTNANVRDLETERKILEQE